jgi:carboxylate-amine ligase
MITLGLEEELQVVDADGALSPHDLSAELEDFSSPEGAMDKEIHQCVIELKTRVCHSVEDLLGALGTMRSLAQYKARRQEQWLVATGLHPTACWHQQKLNEGPHYTRLVDEYQDVARGAMSFGMHLHLGFDGDLPKTAIMNRLRHVLPEALALSASSPYFEERDTGMQSWRHSLLDRYPRMGTPEIWPNDEAYEQHVQRLRRVGCISESQALWQDVRVHHRYGTIEVRIMDTQPELRRIGLIATLLKWEAETIELELRAGIEREAWSRACIDENKWRARRHGLQAQWIDWDRDEIESTPQHFERWWARIAPRAGSLAERSHWERELADALGAGSFSDRLRQQVARQQHWPAVIRWMSEFAFPEPWTPKLASGWA